MAEASKILLLSVVFFLALVGIRGDAWDEDDGEEPEALLRSEVERLTSKIADLQSKIAEASLQVEAKDEALLLLENVVKEKAATIASLHDEIESVQKKGATDVAELEGKTNARTAELEKQIGKLKSDIQAQGQRKDALEARAVEAEKKVEKLNLKLESLQRTNDEQKSRTKKTELALKKAEEELMKVLLEASSKKKELTELQRTNDEQKSRTKKTELALKKAEEELMKVLLEASSKKKELTEIHGAWLPPWLSAHLDQCQATAAAHWKEHGKTSYDAFLQKVSHALARAQKKIEPHLGTAKEKWIPSLKERWVTVRISAEPYAQSVTTKTLQFYETSVTMVKSHIVRVQDIADPYFQEAKKFSKPYVDQVAMTMKPHVEKMQTVLKPYTEQVGYAGGKLLKSATMYHHQVQSAIKGMLKKYELTNFLAMEEPRTEEYPEMA